MFAVLGDIPFEVVGSPESIESERVYDFAEHRVIESKPVLQWMGDGLERLKFDLRLHASFTNPAAQLALLRHTAAAHLALPLVFGNGGFRGYFVIESIGVRSQQLSAKGTPIAIGIALALREWAAGAELLAGALPSTLLPTLGIASSSTSSATASSGAIPGVSALLNVASPKGAAGRNLEAADVPASAIVRSASQ